MAMSGTLQPPRKSIELEDPGAHDLDTSENEEDIFSDAQEGRGPSSGTNSPIPLTRLEKIDSQESYGEVPGTAAYDLRALDAVPDEIKVIPDGQGSRPLSRLSDHDRPTTSGGVAIPKTIVSRIDSASPSHGEVPGTVEHTSRKADAVPGSIVQALDSGHDSSSGLDDQKNLSEILVPTTLLMKVDSKPGQGQVSGTEAYNVRKADAVPDIVEKKEDFPDLPTFSLNRSTLSITRKRILSIKGASPIAADGGFGPMVYEESGDGSDGYGADITEDIANVNAFGEDFDDFEEGALEDDFGDFNEEFQQPPSPKKQESKPADSDGALPSYISPFPILNFKELDSLESFIIASEPYLDELFPTTQNTPPPTSYVGEKYSIFPTDRSLSLWSQLVAPPPSQPSDWVRSRIRRLFLVSLGVPVDLDEILPASKQKKLILPSTNLRSDSNSPSEGRRNGSRVRLKQDNTSSASIDQSSSHKSNRKRKGPPPPPELDLGPTRMLCATTDAALSNFGDNELRAHVRKLEELTIRASEVLEYWLTRKDNALGDKEVFEGVIENLVKHARRVRK